MFSRPSHQYLYSLEGSDRVLGRPPLLAFWLWSADSVDGAGAGERQLPEARGHPAAEAPAGPRADLPGTPWRWLLRSWLGPRGLQVV